MPALTSIALGVGGAASLAGGILNYAANKSGLDRAEMLQKDGVQEWIKLNIPDPKAQELALKQFVQTGTFSPELEQAIKQDSSAFAKVVANPDYSGAQARALAELSRIGTEGGLDLSDRAALLDARMGGINRERSTRGAIVDDMARRGMSGSGYDVAAQLGAQQSGADREAQASLGVAASARDRALKAIMGAGELGGQLRGQDFAEQSARANAADRIAQFNAQNLASTNQRNVASKNAAMLHNLGESQRISDANVGLSNYQQEHNKGLGQQYFNNQATKISGITGQYKGLADTAQKQGTALGNLGTNIGRGIKDTMTTGVHYKMWNDYLNKDDDELEKLYPGSYSGVY